MYNTKESVNPIVILFTSIFVTPFVFIIGLIISLWNGMWASKILELGTVHFGWRSFSICEVLIASLALGVVHANSSSVNKDEKPLSTFAKFLLGPIFTYLLALVVVYIFT